MSFQRIHQSRSQSSQTSSSTSQFAPRPFPVQEPKRPPTPKEPENHAFQQNKFEAFGLQLKEKHGTITPIEQEKLGMLQAKMDSFWVQRMERSNARPNSLEILIRNAQSTATEPAAPVQPKLTIGKPNDQYEQEADRVADQVMSMPDRPAQQSIQRETAPEGDELQTKPIAASITPLVQREAMPEEEEVQAKAVDNSSIQREEMPEEEVQTKAIANSLQREEIPEEEEVQMKAIASIQREEMPEEEEVQTKAIANSLQREEMPEEEEIQTKSLDNTLQREEMPEEEEIQTKPLLQRASDGSLQAGSSIESRLNSSKGGGSPLSDEVRSFMEPRFGTDFNQVRVHTGSAAVQMNRDLNAQAFTHKQDVYFGVGKAPAKDALTAHELTHVLQQTSQKVQPQLQRDDDDSNEPAKLKYELVYLPIDLKDKNNKLISTQSISLELSLRFQAPFNATAGGFRFSFLRPQLSLALGAAFENPTGAATDINKSLSGGASVSIVEVKIPGLSKFLPGTKFKIGGKLESEVDIDALKVETKAKPSIGIRIPLSESQYIELGATSSGAQILGTF